MSFADCLPRLSLYCGCTTFSRENFFCLRYSLSRGELLSLLKFVVAQRSVISIRGWAVVEEQQALVRYPSWILLSSIANPHCLKKCNTCEHIWKFGNNTCEHIWKFGMSIKFIQWSLGEANYNLGPFFIVNHGKRSLPPRARSKHVLLLNPL